jgi:hypothetical protein
MPTPTYVSLATITLGSTEADIVFSSIPATYRDLILVANFSVTASSPGVAVRIRPNSATTNFSEVVMYGTGSGSGTSSTSSSNIDLNYTDATSAQTAIAQFMDYSATDKHKTILRRSGSGASGSNYVWAAAGRWADTTAITSIQLITSSSTLTSGSTFSLFGIVA